MGLVLARVDTGRCAQTRGRSQSLGLPPGLCSAARVTGNSSRWIILWGDERNRRWAGPEQVALPLCLKQWIASASFQLLTKRPSPDKVQEPCLGVWRAAASSTQRHWLLKRDWQRFGTLGSLAVNEFLWINSKFWQIMDVLVSAYSGAHVFFCFSAHPCQLNEAPWKLTGAGRQSLINREVLISRSHGAIRPR